MGQMSITKVLYDDLVARVSSLGEEKVSVTSWFQGSNDFDIQTHLGNPLGAAIRHPKQGIQESPSFAVRSLENRSRGIACSHRRIQCQVEVKHRPGGA
jgi:hypothetical protein